MAKDELVERGPPLTPSQLVARENLSATEPMPAAVARHLQQRRLLLSSPDAQLSPDGGGLRQADVAGGWHLPLSPKTIVGLPGLSSESQTVLSESEAKLRRASLAAFRPPWVDLTLHPRQSGRPDYPPSILRAANGRRSVPHTIGIFGADDRRLYYPLGYPWHCIGKVYAYQIDLQEHPSWSATGVLVGPRHVLTASHSVPWGAEHWKVQFVPAYYDGVSVAGGGGASWVSDFRSLDPHQGYVTSAWDFALLRLYDPLGDELGWFGVKMYDPAWQDGNYWTICGYPEEVTNQRPSYQLGIPVLGNIAEGEAAELHHQGDTTSGNSGGPMFGIWPDGYPYVIGVVSGANLEIGMNICAGGLAMVKMIQHWREHWL